MDRPRSRFDAPFAGAPYVRDIVRPGGRVLVFRALPGIGDLLTAIPAIRAIRIARPDIELALVTLPAMVAVAGRYRRILDDVIGFPGFPGLPDRRPAVRELPAFLADIQARRFDLAIQLHGSGELTNEIVCLFGARHVAGFHRSGRPSPEPTRFLPWHEDESEVVRWIRLVACLGWPTVDTRLELPLSDDADAALDGVLAQADVGHEPGRLAVVHPGAADATRRWRPDGFAAVARRLADHGATVVLTGGSTEKAVSGRVADLADHAGVVDLAGLTTLDALGALIRRASVVVTNDTGISHIADALRTPSVVVFTATSPDRWAPLDTARHRAVSGGSPRRVGDAALALMRDGARVRERRGGATAVARARQGVRCAV